MGLGRSGRVRLLSAGVGIVAAMTVGSYGCATLGEGAAARTGSIAMTLHGKPLELHVSEPEPGRRRNALVLYASGDGGWFGMARTMFAHIVSAGYPAVGISSRALLRIERPYRLDPARLTAEYSEVLDAARLALDVDASRPVILAGWSRGAAFAILASDELSRTANVAGVVAIGLSAGEDLQVSDAGDEPDDHDIEPSHWPFAPYETLAGLRAPLKCAVIQATHDDYLPSAAAQRLFGHDTETRRFYTVDARNHRFSGGREAFSAALVDALAWMAPADSTSDAAFDGRVE